MEEQMNLQNEQQRQEENTIFYKIMSGRKYRVFRKDYNGFTYYNIQMKQQNKDDTISTYYKQVYFKKDIVLPNETDIIINKAVENLRENPKDKYNPISTLFVYDFTTVENEQQKQDLAYEEYRENIKEDNLELPF